MLHLLNYATHNEKTLHLNNAAFLLSFILWANAHCISKDTGIDLKESGV